MRIAVPVLFAAALAALPFSAAKAQYYYCDPLSLPFCIAGAAVGTAATIAGAAVNTAGAIATAPFRGPYYYYGQPYYHAPAYSYPKRKYKRRHRKRK